MTSEIPKAIAILLIVAGLILYPELHDPQTNSGKCDLFSEIFVYSLSN